MALRPVDLAIVILYLFGITVFGLRFRGSDRSLKSYFLGSERVPWWAISLSIVTAETSTLTLVSVPGLAYSGDFSFLQLALGFIAGRILISFTLLPQYFRREIFTAYEWIGHRFGPRLQRATAACFLLTRAAAEGIRVFAVAIVVGMALTLPGSLSGDAAAIGVVIILTLLYTYHGGLNAVIWTDVLQITIYTLASFVGLLSLLHSLPGGWGAFIHMGIDHQKFRIFDLTLDFYRPYTLIAGLFGGIFLTAGSHGTDQLMVQRLLSARDVKKARRALIASGFIVFAQFAFYLTIGAALAVLSLARHGQLSSLPSDRIFPHFIVHDLPSGLSGLLIAAILAAAMSNLSAAVNSLSSTSVMDFYRKAFPATSESRALTIARASTLFWAAVLFGIALLARNGGRVVELGLSIAAVTYGALLGVFVLAWASRVKEAAAIIGMLAGLVLNVWIWTRTRIAFPWYVPLGCGVTVLTALALSAFGLAIPEEPETTSAKAFLTPPTDGY